MKCKSVFQKTVQLFLSASILNLSFSCISYQSAIVPKSRGISIDNTKNYYLITESKSEKYPLQIKRWEMRELSIEDNRISARLYLVNTADYVRDDARSRSDKNKLGQWAKATNHVSLYLSANYDVWSDQTESGKVLIPFPAIQKVEVYDIDLGKTIAYTTLGITGTLGAIFIVILLTKSSCPFIYAYNGESYEFIGEIYSGSIYPPLERHDYLALPNLQPVKNEYKIKITNEIKEIQHTNMTELFVFDHPENIEVLVDKYGNTHTLSNLILPETSKTLDGSNIDSLLSSKDSLVYMSGIPDEYSGDMDALILTFDKPLDQDTGKLVIKGKNSFWLDYIHGQFSELFGERFDTWKEKQKKQSPEKMIKWSLDQGIPLSVYLETEDGWEFADYYNVVGPLAAKEDVLEIDLSKIKGDKVNIKLEFGFLFWEIDYAAMDFTSNHSVEKHTVSLFSAIDQNNDNVADRLMYDDEKYYIQPHVGDEALLTFQVPNKSESTKRSFILHSKGHYEILKEIDGKPDIAYLKGFRESGAFSQFSKNRFMEFYEYFKK